MAIIVEDIVSPRVDSTALPSSAFGPPVQNQPPIFGKVTAEDAPGGPFDVLWTQSGFIVPDIPAAALDLIGAPDATEVTRLRGKTVRVEEGESPDYAGTVVQLYTRDHGGSGSPSSTLALLRIESHGTYREIQSDQLVVVAGR